MKSKLDTDTTPAKKYRKFQDSLKHVLTVSKTELENREKEYQEERATHPKRGPRPSGRASVDKG